MDDQFPQKLYSPVNAARALDISRSSVYRLMKIGRVKFVLIGSDRRIPASEVERVAREGAS